MDDPQLGKGVLEQALNAGYRDKTDYIKAVENVDSNVLEEINNLFKKYIESDMFEKLKLEVYHFLDDLYFHRDKFHSVYCRNS